MKKIIALLFLLMAFISNAQENSSISERFPVFPDCEGQQNTSLETCFYNQVHDFVYNNFKVSEALTEKQYKGSVIVLFEVTDEGKFVVQYVDANEADLITESKAVFE
ncbi:MAG TPA: gliding motility protein RemB, partial [Flavobacterium sp.]|nr:gliding motility protein RemB [Flavobacterium sp.]